MSRQSKILIVDDNPTNVEILEKILGDDYHLATAATGEETLEIAPAFQPALILLDIMMPGIDGYETCRRIKTIPALRHTKVIMVSAKARVSERLQGYEAGADDYISKPFDKHELRAKVRVYLRLKSIEEVDQLKTDLLALLSHETRTPLNGILPPLEMLMSEEDMDTEERKEWFEVMRQSAMRLLSLVTKATTLSAMKAGAWDFHFVSANLGDVVRAAANSMISYASGRNVQIDQELPEAAITMLDREQMQRVVAVMLENAVRFSPSHSRVVVGVRHEDTRFCVTVTDQGVGINTDYLPHVFEEFVEEDIEHRTEGQNLSLAIASQIVLAHNGTISVDSRKGAGTTFTVRLPVMVPTAVPADASCTALV